MRGKVGARLPFGRDCQVLSNNDDDDMTKGQLPFAACLEFLAKRVPQYLKPKVGIICGSGLSTLAVSFTDPVYVPYGEIPGFGTSTGAEPPKSTPRGAQIHPRM